MSNMPSTRLLFGDFDHSISIYCQNAYDIRNQHQKLSLTVYFSTEKKNFFPKSHARGKTSKIIFKKLRGGTGVILTEFFFGKKIYY